MHALPEEDVCPLQGGYSTRQKGLLTAAALIKAPVQGRRPLFPATLKSDPPPGGHPCGVQNLTEANPYLIYLFI